MQFHNSGSLGRQGATTKDLSAAEISDYLASNLVSVASLNAVFLKATSSVPARTVVNVSSIMALQPQSTWSLYCSGKAARDMFFKVVAEEEKQVIKDPSLLVHPKRWTFVR